MRRLLVLPVLISVPAMPVGAQDRAFGASYTLLSLTYPDQIPNGLGGWFTWRVLDVGANLFPEDHPVIGRQAQLLAGARGGLRAGNFAAYARIRPGFVHFSGRFFAPEIV